MDFTIRYNYKGFYHQFKSIEAENIISAIYLFSLELPHAEIISVTNNKASCG